MHRARYVGLLVGLTACIEEPAPPPAELGTFPYNPLVYELDLAILAYQVHAQSMVWPIDPFYEEHASGSGTARDTLMTLVREWAARRGAAQIGAQVGLDGYRGPGLLGGLPDNRPTITRRIRDVYVSARAIGGDGSAVLAQVVPGRVDADADATDASGNPD